MTFSLISWQWIHFSWKKETKYYTAASGTLPQWDNMYFKSLGTSISHFPLNHTSLPVFGVSVLCRESLQLCMGTNWYSELKVVLIINSPPLHYPVMIQMNNWKFNSVTVTQNVWEHNVSPSFLGFMGCHGCSGLKKKKGLEDGSTVWLFFPPVSLLFLSYLIF